MLIFKAGQSGKEYFSMTKVLKAAGVICGILAFLIFLWAGIKAGGEAPAIQSSLAMFFFGFAFFAASLLLFVSAGQGGPASSAGTKKQKPAKAKKSSPKKKPDKKGKSDQKGEVVSIYVGNLSQEANEAVLKTAFSGFGEIARVKIVKQRGGRPKGFGFVEMYGKDAAESAIEALNGKELAGRQLKVNLAKTKTKPKPKPKPESRPRTESDEITPEERNIFD